MTLQTEWENFARISGLADSRALKRAFFAGAAAMFDLMLSSADGSEEQGEVQLSMLKTELLEFAANVGTPTELSAERRH